MNHNIMLDFKTFITEIKAIITNVPMWQRFFRMQINNDKRLVSRPNEHNINETTTIAEVTCGRQFITIFIIIFFFKFI